VKSAAAQERLTAASELADTVFGMMERGQQGLYLRQVWCF
jgi:hypothetical protein